MKSQPVSTSAPVAVVVNDDATQLTMLAGLLTKAGLNPRVFTGAEAALADMTANTGPLPALIVTDLYMPLIDGWRFCRLLRSPEYTALNHVPIIVVSATYEGDEPNRIAADLGAETFLSSPVDGKIFAEQVQAILNKKKVQYPLRVLIVEDSKTQAGILKKAFVANCYEADTAFTLAQAFAAFGKTTYDVAVLDYHLPDGAGDALLDKFRAVQPNCVCLMMTTDSAPGLALEWMKRGAAAYLRKPFNPEYLIELCANARRERGLLRVQDLLETRTRELRESEERYRNLFDNAHEAIFVAQDGNLVYLNARTATQLGYSTEEIQLKSFIEFIHPDDQEMVIDNHFKRMRGEEIPNIYTFRVIHRDGSVRWTELNAISITWKEKPATLNFMTDITDRKRAVEELQKRERTWTTLISNLPGFVYRCANDRDWTMEYISEGCREITGYAPDDFLQNGTLAYNDIVRTDYRQPLWEKWQEVLSKREAFEEEYPIITASGKTSWVWERGRGIYSEDGRLLYLEGFITNITERKQAEDSLRESEEKYRLIFENSPLGILYFDQNGIIIACNESFIQIIGSSREALIGLSMLKLPDKNIVSTVQKALSGSTGLYEGIYSSTTAKKITPMRSIFAPMTSDGGIVLGGVGIIEDITERKLAEDALRASEERYKSIISVSNTGAWEYHIDTDYLWCSPEYFSMLGYRSADFEMSGKANLKELWVDLLHPEDVEHATDNFSTYLKNGSVGMYENYFRMRHKDGHLVWIWSRGQTLRNAAGDLSNLTVGTHINITESKQADENKSRLEAQLQQAQKMESIGRLAGGVAHDFNNMLSVILGYSELAIRKAGADNPLQRHLAQILDAARRSADLTKQLLAFARQQTIAPIVLDLNKTIESMLKMLHRLIGEDIELKWHPKADLWPVKVDPSQIDQILANLCINSRDAISDVGKITIETENSTLDNDYCANHPGFVPGDYLKLTVSDDGYGMSKEIQDNLFEPFFTTKEMGKGTGLGLATVYGIVKQNNGFINVQSEPGQGTTFTIYLLRHTAETLRTQQVGSRLTAAGGNETILLVEDEPAILEMAMTMLEGQGYVVRAAVTPVEAMRLAKEHKGEIDLLVTDVVMPGMNGRDLAKNLMSLYPHLKRLFMSGYTANVIAHRGVLDEGVYFIQKPFSIDDLSAKVREALDGNENPF